MNAKRRLVLVAAIVVVVGTAWPAVTGTPTGTSADMSAKQVVAERLDRMPLLFVPEQASPDGATGFAVRGRDASIWLSETGIAYRLHGAGDSESKTTAQSWVVALDLVGATPRRPVGEDALPTKVSYFRGPKEQWRTGLPSYGSVRYQEPWSGVDLVISGTAGELESTFVVRPGADPGLIRLSICLVTSLGAWAPGMRTAPITRSASAISSMIVIRFEIYVVTCPWVMSWR
jgi:hypothetical protein